MPSTQEYGIRLNASDNTSAAFDSLTKRIGTLVAGVLTAREVFGFLKESIEEASKAETGQRRLEQQIRRLGMATNETMNQVNQYGKAVQEASRFEDDEYVAAVTRAIQITSDYQQSLEIVRLAMDASVSTGLDLSTTTEAVARASQGNTRGLMQLGVVVKGVEDEYGKITDKTESWNLAQKELHKRFDGAAAKDLETYSGSVAQMTVDWKNLKEEIGTKMLPAMTELVKQMQLLFKDREIVDGMVGVASMFAQMARGVGVLTDSFRAWAHFMALIWHGEWEQMRLEFEGVLNWRDQASESLPPVVAPPSTGGAANSTATGLRTLASMIEQYNIPTTKALNEQFADMLWLLRQNDEAVRAFARNKIGEMFGVEPVTKMPAFRPRAGLYQQLPDFGVPRGATNANELMGGLPSENDYQQAAFDLAKKRLGQLSGLAMNFGNAFQNSLAGVFRNIKSLADLASLRIKDVFDALGQAILEILAQIAAKMAVLGLLSLFTGIPFMSLAGGFKGLLGGGGGAWGNSWTGGTGGLSPAVAPTGGSTMNFFFPNMIGNEDNARAVAETIKRQMRYNQSALSGSF